MAMHGNAWQCMAKHGKAWQSMAKHGKAWQSMAKHGKAWQGDVKGRNSVLTTDRQTDGETEGQEQVLSCASAVKKKN